MTLQMPLKLINWTLGLCLVASLTGCLNAKQEAASTQKLPDWVTSPPSNSSHIYGVGSASRIENLALAFAQAEQNGNAQIAQQLRTQVSQLNTQDTQVISNGNSEQVTKLQSAYTQVRTAPIELEQTKNEARFTADNYVYALQSINRTRLISKLSEQLAELDTDILRQAESITLHGEPKTADWQSFMRLIPLFAQRARYVEQLNLYSQQSRVLGEANQEIAGIESALNKALLHYGFDTSKTHLASQLSSALSTYGLSPKQDSVFTLRSKGQSNIETQSGRFYAFEEGSLELLSPKGELLGSWNIQARGIAKNQESALNKAAENWASQAIDSMFLWLTKR
ncbi:LPP20 family lipoprotein [Marinomonas sp. C2222]|uniref:LPP20 family lipoprotein n=1 Tax=Marinomonas sargassi TaxID=2984494 RepID=A0ABT2YP86_9GAMM|nr:LPP20 family lipoprotein [Marinomonas sargassi]MCV2401704.1 LPP20 family lipoprotein [Marinomonas sargassi]